MFSDVRQHAIYAIGNARVREFPYPYFLGEQIFPSDFYQELLGHLPDKEKLTAIIDSGRVEDDSEDSPYKNRFIVTLTKDAIANFAKKDQTFWYEMLRLLKNVDFTRVILWKFDSYLRQRYHDDLDQVDFTTDIQLIRDFKGYHLGPHSDSPNKVAVLLLYLPETGENSDLGTSIYVPKQEGFTCIKGMHYSVEDFHRVFTAAYVPNTALGFFKTPNSFHGVEPVTDANVRRDVIQYSIMQI